MIDRVGRLSAALGAVALITAASAAGPKPAPLDAANAKALVDARQAGMLLSGVAMGHMKDAVDAGTDVKNQRFAARNVARWARVVPELFPAGSDLPDSGAAPTVWSDRAGFNAKAADYAAAATKLADLATAGDQAGFAAQWTVVRGACKDCHDGYQKHEQKPKS